MDLELQDAVAKGLVTDETAQEALHRLKDPETQPTKWHFDKGADSQTCLFYNGKMYVPDDLALQQQIISDHHDSLVAGHLGALATTRSVRLSYWWPGLTTFIRNYVAECATC